jgi:hypothetical protein
LRIQDAPPEQFGDLDVRRDCSSEIKIIDNPWNFRWTNREAISQLEFPRFPPFFCRALDLVSRAILETRNFVAPSVFSLISVIDRIVYAIP